MKIFCFILLFSMCHSVDKNYRSEYFWSREVKDGIYYTDGKSDDHYNGGDYLHSIIRPCSLHDLNCIRGFFTRNSQCSPAQGPAPDPYMMQRLDLRIPHANLTFTLINAQVKGLNEWKIKEFYINKATDKLVLVVEFDRIVVASPGVNISYHRKGKEPIEVTDYSIIEYYGVSFTLTIPHISDLKLSKGHVYSYIPDPVPNFTLGPTIYGVKDPGFVMAFRKLVSDLGLSLQELFVNQGPVFMSVFLQSTICDFKHN